MVDRTVLALGLRHTQTCSLELPPILPPLKMGIIHLSCTPCKQTTCVDWVCVMDRWLQMWLVICRCGFQGTGRQSHMITLGRYSTSLPVSSTKRVQHRTPIHAILSI